MSNELLYIKLKDIIILQWIINSAIRNKIVILPFKNQKKKNTHLGVKLYFHIFHSVIMPMPLKK
jgi:hypothetical protein